MKIIGITGHANIETPFGVKYNPDEYNEDIFNKVYKDIKEF